MTNLTLQKKANKLYKKYFNQNLNCYVCFNPRLRTTGGRFLYTRVSNSRKGHIEINPRVIDFDKSEPENTIKHELIHYYLWRNNQPCGHNILFKELANRLHCSLFMPASFGRSAKTEYHIYQCKSCGYIILRKRKMNIKKYYCANKVKNNFGMTVTCHGTWKDCGTVTVAQLKQKNNKIDRLKRNFKHKTAVKDRLYSKLNHTLGYKDLYFRTESERASIQGNIMNLEFGKLLPKFSAYARKQFIHELNSQDIYTHKQALMKMRNYHIDKHTIVYQYVKKSVPKITHQIKNSSNTFVNLQLDDETGLGWYLTRIDDDSFLNALSDFAYDNYTNGVKLYKQMINYMKKHNQDYKVVEKHEKQKVNA